MADNTLYYGDNLDVLRQHIKDQSVDLIYLDPPFNSKQDYAVFFKEKDGTAAAAQIKAFKDTWHWDQDVPRTYEEVVEAGGKVSEAMRAFKQFLGTNDMLAYLTMMAPRLKELYRVLKPTGSLYLHCDPTASHYLKILMDAAFGATNYRNEIIWERTTGRKGGMQFGRVHDVILFYSKSDIRTWNPQAIPHGESPKGHDLMRDERGRVFRLSDLTGGGKGPPRRFGEQVIEPPANRHWMFDQVGIDALWNQGRIIFTKGGKPRLKNYIQELAGIAVRDVWTDIDPINAAAAERLGYPTQKPVQLLRRIILSSSRPGDLILDPFYGCGTAIDATEQLNRENPNKPPRRWIGIDITHLATNLIKYRLFDAFGESCKYKVVGEPTSLPDAEQLAKEDPHQFQEWALGLVYVRCDQEHKKGADKGIDGRLYFHDEQEGGDTKKIIISVKGGKNIHANMVSELVGVLGREKAQIGVIISMYPFTKPMRNEAASAGFYESPGWHTKHSRLQLLTIEELLSGKKLDMPPTRDMRTFKKAQKFKPEQAPDKPLPLDLEAGE